MDFLCRLDSIFVFGFMTEASQKTINPPPLINEANKLLNLVIGITCHQTMGALPHLLHHLKDKLAVATQPITSRLTAK